MLTSDPHAGSHRVVSPIGGVPLLLALLNLGCDTSPVPREPVPTSLSGQVFRVTRDGATIKASGRTVSIVTPTRQILDTADSTCGHWRNAQTDLLLSNREPRKYLESREILGAIANAEVVRSVYGEPPNATVTADLNGEFDLPAIQPGNYLLWTRTQIGDEPLYWMAYETVRAGMANRVILGTDASDWQGMCNAVNVARRGFAGAEPR